MHIAATARIWTVTDGISVEVLFCVARIRSCSLLVTLLSQPIVEKQNNQGLTGIDVLTTIPR